MAASDSGFVLVVSSAPLNGFASSTGTRGRTGELVVLMDDFRGTFTLQRWSANDSGKTIGTVPRSAAAQGRAPVRRLRTAVGADDAWQ